MPDTTVTIAGGTVRGRVVDGVASFLGLPYAAPPFGAGRMRPPRPVEPWDGTRDATAYGPTVPKGDYPPEYRPYFPEPVIPGEECLNLNVWTPGTGTAGLPVLVWLHGGDFMNGSGAVGEYDGTAFARDGVVCVTINYRLSAEGFLYLGGDTGHDDGANLGLLDQIAALRWVQDNIAFFGGDPGRVTVAGESSGAMCLTTLLSMPAADGLFAQAIAQSGAAAHTLDRAQGTLVARHLADALGVPPRRDAFRRVPAGDLVRAAEALASDVLHASDPAKWKDLPPGVPVCAPTVDGTLLPVPPLDGLAAGQGAGVPLLIGTNRDEARLFLIAAGTLERIDDAALAGAAAGFGLAPDGVAVYRANRPGASPGDVLAAITTDWLYRVPAVRVAEARAGAPTWMYRFDRPDPPDNRGLGACHGVDMPFVFGTIGRPDVRPRVGDAPSQAVSGTVRAAWTSFIADGDPGWAPYGPDARRTGLITERVGEVADPASGELALWAGIR